MNRDDEMYLKQHFASHNSELSDLLQRVGFSLPLWLREGVVGGGEGKGDGIGEEEDW